MFKDTKELEELKPKDREWIISKIKLIKTSYRHSTSALYTIPRFLSERLENSKSKGRNYISLSEKEVLDLCNQVGIALCESDEKFDTLWIELKELYIKYFRLGDYTFLNKPINLLNQNPNDHR